MATDLTIEQLLEVALALMYGQQEGSMATLTEQKRQEHYERERRSIRESIAAFPDDEKQRRMLEQNLAYVGRPDLGEQAMREAFLNATGELRRNRRAGLKQGINDSLHLIERGYFPASVLAVINRRLEARNLPKIDELMMQFRGTHLKILKRGKIRDEEEFHVVKNIVDDLESDVTAKQRMKLSQMLADFELRKNA